MKIFSDRLCCRSLNISVVAFLFFRLSYCMFKNLHKKSCFFFKKLSVISVLSLDLHQLFFKLGKLVTRRPEYHCSKIRILISYFYPFDI